MSKVYLTEDSGGIKLRELKTELIDLIKNQEGITTEELVTKMSVDAALIDALLAELSNEGTVRIYS